MKFSAHLNNFQKNLFSLNPSYFWVFLLIIYPLFFIFQGLDFTDQGFWVTGYQLIFKDPESILVMMPTWLSLVIGGLVDLTGFGLISFRIAFVLILWITIYLSYRLLTECFKKEEILFPLFLTLIYITKCGVNWINYNNLSAVFFLGASIPLWLGLQRKNYKLIVWSGFILGLAIYLRIPNLMGLALVAGILFAGWFDKWHISLTVRFVLFFFSGWLGGILLGLIAIKLSGDLRIFLISIFRLASHAAQPSYHHSMSMLWNLFIDEHISAIRYGFLVIVILLILSWIQKYKLLIKFFVSDYFITIRRFIYIVIIFSLAVYLEHNSRYLLAVPGFCYAVLILGIISEIRSGSRSYALLYFISIVLLLIVPLGSNNGMGNSIYGSWLALPLSIIVLRRNLNVRYLEPFVVLRLMTPLRNDFGKVIIGVLLLISLHITYISTYRDSADRSALRYTSNSPKLKGILTSKERSQVVDELLKELKSIVNPGDSLLAITDIPMVHYLTDTRPFLSNPWVSLIDNEELASDFAGALKNSSALPVLIRTKGPIGNPEWPNIEITPPQYFGEGELLIKSFISTNNYRKKWENKWFEIWTASEER